MGLVRKAVVVVPCFNEERRLIEAAFTPLIARERLDVLFVDDGSRDQTSARLHEIAARAPKRMSVLALAQNGGKAEAVRQGMLRALEQGADLVGYMDADASAPASEVLRLLDAMHAHGADVVIGARVQLLGGDVQRRRSRHYLGRVFATIASAALALPVYDTQCGAKFFRDVPALRAALERPFSSRWAFDVELLGRLLMGTRDAPALAAERFVEVPLARWSDVAGSKLSAASMLKSGLELAAIGLELRRARRRNRR